MSLIQYSRIPTCNSSCWVKQVDIGFTFSGWVIIGVPAATIFWGHWYHLDLGECQMPIARFQRLDGDELTKDGCATIHSVGVGACGRSIKMSTQCVNIYNFPNELRLCHHCITHSDVNILHSVIRTIVSVSN